MFTLLDTAQRALLACSKKRRQQLGNQEEKCCSSVLLLKEKGQQKFTSLSPQMNLFHLAWTNTTAYKCLLSEVALCLLQRRQLVPAVLEQV